MFLPFQPGFVAHTVIPNINDSLAHPQPVRIVHIDAIAFHLEQFWACTKAIVKGSCNGGPCAKPKVDMSQQRRIA
jgi:hypothetical protein